MRPLELTVEGFRSYRDRATFDWRGRRLVGIVGPIGSGKSSILDAISFALYGKTPQVESATKSLIHQLADQSHVELRFQVDGQVWRAVRSLRKRGASGHQLELLADDVPDAEVLEVVTLEGPMNERIEQLLGMDFKTFCRSVLLAQNRFAEFLKATPAQRDAVLKGVFGFERLDDALRAAKSRLERADETLASLEKERERVNEARAELEEARATARATGARLSDLERAGPEVERLEKERDAAAADAEAAAARIAGLGEIAGGLPSEEDVGVAVDAALAAETRIAEAKAAAEQASTDKEAREAELADVRSRLGDPERFRSFEHLVQAHERLVDDDAKARAEVERTEGELAAALSSLEERTASSEAAEEALTAADASLVAAGAAVDEARTTLMAAVHAEMAHELRSTLAAGEPCPVCRQEVHAVPGAGAAPKVAAARKALKKFEAKETAARDAKERCAAAASSAATAVEEAGRGADRAGADRSRAAASLETVEAELIAVKSQLVEGLHADGDFRTLFEARQAELIAAERAFDEARAQLDRARAGLDETKRLAEGADDAIAHLANRLSGLWGRLDESRDVPRDPQILAESFAGLRAGIVARHDEAVSMRETAGARAGEAIDARSTLLETIGLTPTDDFRRALAEAGVAHGTADARVRELEERISSASELERQVTAAESRRDIAKRLADDLQPSRFLGFLLEEERAELGELGSEHFEQLTDGAFRFTDDDRFEIVDLNAAGMKRKADSLSGGETFLASLALALALAEMVARGGGRLDSFFLDEGFGSLDPEHLDRAMEGIGRLVSADDRRLVVLVSHVAEMREAIEDLIVLDKHDVTGDTMVRSGAGPAT
jgi:exonuclease SbcC